MKMDQNSFVVEQKKLSTILGSMQAICAKRTTLDTTSSILFQAGHNELVLKSTDLELSLQYSCVLDEDSTIENIQFLVPGRRVFELTKELEGAININVKDNQIALKSGNASLSLNIKDAQEFPPFPERIENLMEIKTDDLLFMLEKVSFLIPQNNANPALNGLLIEIDKQGIKMTATDGHCLSQVQMDSYKLDASKKWLLPRRAILELKKIIDTSNDTKIFIGICGNQLVFSGESFNLFSKLLVDAFPEYQQILNRENFIERAVPKADLIKALRRSACLLSGQFIATEFNFDNEKLEVALHNKEVGKLKETLALTKSNTDKLDIRFYAPYLLSGIQVLPGETVGFWLQNNSRPIIFEAEEKKCQMIFLVMPVSPISND
ncbi:TPA: DNA polymerase III subunit beta [Candidatus Dependentiae bacterium]|nr:MAG: polymerase III subunit beta protein [candidate division TM6 bacterium GW2011_GWF2_36_131]KKQ03199.1 MAG: polymerase III subunit beta protein [candidate division TM6 bacterium GW2011_GWE2_36_25]KKQ18558.1 MAG: polymerase III subunit beta protein [candidate division TM6 bacterium GW2011_GWA2_36_9]HBR70371.1 DNA polymerase III subunit beta [Candidatus Dependentiae bacterium]HCU00916.1 DNA polymerase III subunit beta [Candidatus Dependentiae bacterium]